MRTRKASSQSAVASRQSRNNGLQSGGGGRQSTTQIERILVAHLHALNGRNLDALLSFYADDAVLEFPASPPAHGLGRIRQAFQSFFDQWEETSTYRTIVVSGAVAAVEGTAVGHHRTLHLRIPGRVAAGSREYRHDFAMFAEFADGKIKRHRVYFDARDLVKQLLG